MATILTDFEHYRKFRFYCYYWVFELLVALLPYTAVGGADSKQLMSL